MLGGMQETVSSSKEADSSRPLHWQAGWKSGDLERPDTPGGERKPSAVSVPLVMLGGIYLVLRYAGSGSIGCGACFGPFS
jgi:hypothetical protein